MKKILGVLWILALVLSGCSKSNMYMNALPADAAAMVALDLNSMAQKAGLNDKGSKALKGRLKAMMKGSLPGAENLVDRIFENVNETGLDLAEKVFLFAGEGGVNYGVVAKVDDAGKLEDFLTVMKKQQLCADIKDTDGGKWTVIGGLLMAYSDDTFVMLFNTKDNDGSKQERRASMMLRQEDGEGFVAKDDFKELSGTPADAAVWMSLEFLPREMSYPLTMGISGELSLSDVKSVFFLNFEKGKTIVECKALMYDATMNKLYEKQMEATGEIKGKYIDLFPANTPVWVTANMNGKEMYNLISDIPTMKMVLDKSILPLDFEAIFGALKGDCAMAITNLAKSNFIMMADVDNSDFMKNFEDLKPLMKLTNGQMTLNSTSDNEYEFYTTDASNIDLGRGPVRLWFGVRNSVLYLTNDHQLVDRKVLGLSLADKEWSKDVQGKRFYLTINMQSIKTGAGERALFNVLGPNAGLLFNGLDYMTLSADEEKFGKIEFVMTNKNKTLLEILGSNL